MLPKLNKDILYLIFKELQDDKRTLYSCLTVDKTWCETIIPILWRNLWSRINLNKKKVLLNVSNVIFSHLSDESRNNLKNQGVDFSTSHHEKLLFNYIRFLRHLDLNSLNIIIQSIVFNIEKSVLSSVFLIVRKEIFNLFINENTRFTHLYIPYQFDYQLHHIPGAKLCFSELEFLSCNARIYDEVLIGLIEICDSVKELILYIDENNNNYEIVKLIKAIKRLLNVRFLASGYKNDESFCKILEESLIKHANSIQHFKLTKQPVTKIISSFVNLNKLELGVSSNDKMTYNCLNDLSLPFLQVLRARCVPVKVLTGLIENTSGHLTEIKIDYIIHNVIDNESIIRAIYKKCPKLEYLKLVIRDNNISELENLLVNCQYLSKLYIIINNGHYSENDILFNWNYLFEVLAKSSPTSLFDFKFCFLRTPQLESLKLFLDNWKNRHPMLLKTTLDGLMILDEDWNTTQHFNLIGRYKAQGVIKRYSHVNSMISC
ncbi:hypothetical protein RclHR1_02140009 [Rhizophagus clarus]|uniref:F-box domain-containing protein n=1 Tax=Rhizophagus clarus TaxID=94130 RepID=A0A2Z6RLQ9_9GLOM|nr:hypothetical protein RclHR1_02140009 [Rhizophagus clarus]GES84972.1 hypothetical protein GLOIN_2v1784962 [Rhizophagus clarus]